MRIFVSEIPGKFGHSGSNEETSELNAKLTA